MDQSVLLCLCVLRDCNRHDSSMCSSSFIEFVRLKRAPLPWTAPPPPGAPAPSRPRSSASRSWSTPPPRACSASSRPQTAQWGRPPARAAASRTRRDQRPPRSAEACARWRAFAVDVGAQLGEERHCLGMAARGGVVDGGELQARRGLHVEARLISGQLGGLVNVVDSPNI